MNSDSTFLKIMGASYGVYSANKNADIKQPLKLYDYCLSGFDGAFASKCLEDYVPVIIEYAKPLTDYVVDSSFIESLSGGLVLDYLWQMFVGVFSPAENQELVANEFLKTLATAYTFFISTGQILPIATALILVIAAIAYKEKVQQRVANSKSAQMGLAVMISVFTAKLAGFFNPTLVNLLYLVVCARKKSDFVKKLTDRIVVEPFSKRFIKPLKNRLYEWAEKVHKEKIDAKANKSLKHFLVSALIGARENNELFRTASDPLVNPVLKKKIYKKLNSSNGPISSAGSASLTRNEEELKIKKEKKPAVELPSSDEDSSSEAKMSASSEEKEITVKKPKPLPIISTMPQSNISISTSEPEIIVEEIHQNDRGSKKKKNPFSSLIKKITK